MDIDATGMQKVFEERLRVLGADGFSDEESGGPMPEFFQIPGLRKVLDSTRYGERWTGKRQGRKVTVWRGTKWFQLASRVQVSGPAEALDARSRHGDWVPGESGTLNPLLAETPAGPGTVRLRSGPDGVRIRRRQSTHEFMTPAGRSAQWADLILAERLAGENPDLPAT
jgi:hypothetical protein